MVYWESTKKKIAIRTMYPPVCYRQYVYVIPEHFRHNDQSNRLFDKKLSVPARMTKTFLEKYGVPYESIDVGADEEAARKMIERSPASAEFRSSPLTMK